MYVDKLLLANSISAFILIIFIFFLLHKGRKRKSNLLLVLFFFSQVMGLIGDTIYAHSQYIAQHYVYLIFIGMPASLLWAPSLYLYVSSITTASFWSNKRNLIHLIPFISYACYFLFAYHLHSTAEKHQLIEPISNSLMVKLHYYVVHIQILVYNVFSLRALYMYRKKQKNTEGTREKIKLRWLTYIIIGYVMACFLDDLVVTYLQQFFPYNGQVASTIIFFILFVFLFYTGFTSQEVFLTEHNVVKYGASTLSKDGAQEILRKLDDYTLHKKPYYDPDLTIKMFARKMEEQERHISQVINTYKKQNFYDFINGLRIQEAKKLLSDPLNNLNVLQILYEVGFNSKTAFNKAFKKHTGTTPTMYKKHHYLYAKQPNDVNARK